MANVTRDGAASKNDSGSRASVKTRNKDGASTKRKCVSTACIACRRRKSKCDGSVPSCAACASVYGTECVYDPNSDHRRKGVYKKGVDSTKTQDGTLRVLIEGILNCPENEVLDLVKKIRTCESLEDVAQSILARNAQLDEDDEEVSSLLTDTPEHHTPRFEKELSGKLGGIRLENGAMQFLGGTSNLLYVDNESNGERSDSEDGRYATREEAIRSWTNVTHDTSLVLHLIHMYFTWHYSYFTTLSRPLFFRDFLKGRPASTSSNKTTYCTSLLVNAILALGCHFTSWPSARADPEDSSTAGDHFFKECKTIIVSNDEYEHARIATVQALALMSVREAGCGREAKGWIYSGMSFRMALDLGLPYETSNTALHEEEADARRVTFWGCYLFDKCWSNYLGRPPQLSLDSITMKKFDVFPQEDSENWAPWTDSGVSQTNAQPARTRAIALQISALCEISSDLLLSFYKPNQLEKPLGKQAELKKLGDLHTRLEAWRRDLPKEFEAKEGQLPQVLIMHMFFYLLFIHLFRPFLKYTQSSSPLPPHVSPRRHCTQAAAAISKLLRLYKKTHGLRQICNIAVYIAHSACTIHILNLQDKDSRRDLAHGLKHLEEIAECWLCARRTLNILQHQIRKWDIELPNEAQDTLERADAKFQFSKMKHDGRSDGGSPLADTVPTTSLDGQSLHEPPVSPGHSSQSMISVDPDPSSQPRAPAIAPPNLPARSTSPAQRAELLRQMQLNSLQTQSTSQFQAPGQPGRHTQHPKWNEDMWRLDYMLQSRQMPASGGTTVKGQKRPRPTEPTSMHDQQGVTSPTAMFAQQQPPNIFEEQRDWWLRDQSTFFDGWMKRESVSGPRPDVSGLLQASNDNAAAGDLLGSNEYASLINSQVGTLQPSYNLIQCDGNGATNWGIQDRSSGVQGSDMAANDANYGRYDNGMI